VSWTEDDLPDLTGRTAVVTGSNSGIGLWAARALAGHGARVVLACRNEDAATRAARDIDGDTEVVVLDLSSLESARRAAGQIDGPVDLLINNAGVMNPPRYRETPDGFELMYGTNHLGHVALTAHLMPKLLAAPAPRVVCVASVAHHGGTDKVLEANPPEGYKPEAYYGNTKLANILFARELNRRAAAAGSHLTATAAHPGVSATGLVGSKDGMGANPVIRAIAPAFTRLAFQSARAGARPVLYAATEAEPGSYTGHAWLGEWRGPVAPAKLSRYAKDDDLAARLWEKSLTEAGVRIDF
jgi:NAD(P)-dependent dehydrogenase (short-subunit alcohol dehydrogenase family)